MTKEIKVGDWVRLKKYQDAAYYNLDQNKLYKVLEVGESLGCNLIYIDADANRPNFALFAPRFDLIRSIDDGFKIGDVINWGGEDSSWQNITIEEVGDFHGDVKYGEGKRADGVLGGFYLGDPETELISVAEEKTIESTDGSFKILFSADELATMELNSKVVEKSHVLTAEEAKDIVGETYASLDDVVSIYNLLTNNGFVIKKVD